MPAGPAYGPLLAELRHDVDARPKDLEVYAADAPPIDYSLATEVAGITRVANAAGFERFHLVGYSGGGASSLAFAGTHPERLLSLALMEPAFAGWQGMTTAERSHFERFRPLLDMDGPEILARFQALQLAPASTRRRLPPARRPRGWQRVLPDSMRYCEPSSTEIWTSRRFGALNDRFGSRSAVAATPTTSPGWPSASRQSSRTSRSRCSRTDITSTRRTGSSLPGSRHRCDRSGRGPSTSELARPSAQGTDLGLDRRPQRR